MAYAEVFLFVRPVVILSSCLLLHFTVNLWILRCFETCISGHVNQSSSPSPAGGTNFPVLPLAVGISVGVAVLVAVTVVVTVIVVICCYRCIDNRKQHDSARTLMNLLILLAGLHLINVFVCVSNCHIIRKGLLWTILCILLHCEMF